MMYKLLLLLFSLSCFSCGSKSCLKYYAFEFPVTVSPAQDTFQVGDTIWYEMSLPNEMLDKKSGEYIDFSEFDLFFSFNVSKIDTTIVTGATLLFDIHTEIGNIEQNTNRFTYTYVQFKDIKEKHFKFGVIPREKGVFGSSVHIPSYFLKIESSDTERLGLVDPNCIEYMVEESQVQVNNGNVNYYLVDSVCQFSPYDSLLVCPGDYELMSSRGGFAFVVE